NAASGHAGTLPSRTYLATAQTSNASAAARKSISGVCANVASGRTDAQKMTAMVMASRSHGFLRKDETPKANAAITPDATTASKNASPMVRIDGKGAATRFDISSDTFAAAGKRAAIS